MSQNDTTTQPSTRQARYSKPETRMCCARHAAHICVVFGQASNTTPNNVINKAAMLYRGLELTPEEAADALAQVRRRYETAEQQIRAAALQAAANASLPVTAHGRAETTAEAMTAQILSTAHKFETYIRDGQ